MGPNTVKVGTIKACGPAELCRQRSVFWELKMAIIERTEVATQQALEICIYGEFVLGLWLSSDAACM